MGQHYKTSGKFSPLAFAAFIGLCITAFPLLGLIYAYAIWYIPLIYINFLIAAGFGFAVGFLVKKFVIRLGKVRNATLGFALGLLGSIVAMYFHWAVWVDLVLNISDTLGAGGYGVAVSNANALEVFNLALDPVPLFSLIGEIKELGTWGLAGDTPVSGVFLLIVWILEFGIIAFVSITNPSSAARLPFSEAYNEWYEAVDLPEFDFITDPIRVTEALTREDGTELLPLLQRPFSSNESHSVFTVYSCKDDVPLLEIVNKIAKTNKKGEIEFDDQELAPYTYISEALKSQLMEFPLERVERSTARDDFDKL